MSKERARRRVARLAEAEERRRADERRAARRARWRAVRRRLPRRGRVGRIATRRSRAQRTVIAVVVALVLGLVWYFVDAWPLRIGAAVLCLLALPALVTLTLDRSTR